MKCSGVSATSPGTALDTVDAAKNARMMRRIEGIAKRDGTAGKAKYAHYIYKCRLQCRQTQGLGTCSRTIHSGPSPDCNLNFEASFWPRRLPTVLFAAQLVLGGS